MATSSISPLPAAEGVVHTFKDASDDRAHAAGLEPAAYDLLLAFQARSEQDEAPLWTLAEDMQKDRATVLRVARQCVAARLAEWRLSMTGDDGLRIGLALTPKGWHLLERLVETDLSALVRACEEELRCRRREGEDECQPR